MKKNYLIFLMLASVLILTGCSNSTDNSLINDGEDIVDRVHVTFKSGIESTSSSTNMVKSAANKDELYSFDKSIYEFPFNTYNTVEQSSNLGEQVKTATPSNFITGLDHLGVAHPNYTRPLMPNTHVRKDESSAFYLTPLLDLVYAKNIIDTSALFERGTFNFEQVELNIWADNLGPDRNNSFSILSEIHVDLGDEYRNIIFENELIDPKFAPANDNIHVFALKDLIPLKDVDNRTALVSFFFDKNIDKPKIVNPDGDYVEDFNPYFWDSDRRSSRSGYIVYYPAEELDFSTGNKELVFTFNLANLIEVYDNSTPDNLEDDLVTLKLSNPFPISFNLETYEEDNSIAESPKDVRELNIRYYDYQKNQIALRWINPSQEGFKQIHVIRKENEEPKDIDDGTEVYTDTFPICFDSDIKSDTTYFYKVFVENTSGDISSGKSISVDVGSF